MNSLMNHVMKRRMMQLILNWVAPWTLLACLAASANAQPQYLGPGVAGLVLSAEHRFDPAVQRLLAERALRALPLLDGQLYYVYPMQRSTGHLETMQIQYLEQLLQRRQPADQENDATFDEPAEQ